MTTYEELCDWRRRVDPGVKLVPGPANYWELYLWERPRNVVPPRRPRGRIAGWPEWVKTAGEVDTRKACPRCKLWFEPEIGFYRASGSNDGRQGICKNCSRECARASYVKYRDDRVARSRRYADSSEGKRLIRERRLRNRETVNAYARQYYAFHPEIWADSHRVWAKKNAARNRANQAAWRAANKLLVAEYQSRRRIRLQKGRIVTFTMSQLAERVAVFGDLCAYCREPWSHLDHVKPLALGGPHCLANLRPACASCNQRKHAKTPAVWFAIVREGKHK